MRISNKKATIILSIIVITSLILLLLSTESKKEIKKFYNTFGIGLSKKTKIIYNKSVFGALGDGEGLIIYEVSPKDMQEIIEEDSIMDWLRLPISKKTSDKLHEKVGLDSEEIKEYLNLDRKEGFYAVVDRLDSSNTKLNIRENLDFFKFQNFTLGIIDIKENKIYLYKYNQ